LIADARVGIAAPSKEEFDGVHGYVVVPDL